MARRLRRRERRERLATEAAPRRRIPPRLGGVGRSARRPAEGDHRRRQAARPPAALPVGPARPPAAPPGDAEAVKRLLLLAAVLALWLSSCFVAVDQAEFAYVTQFGRLVATIDGE